MYWVVQVNDATGDVKVLYDSQRKYEQITGRLHMLREWKVGARVAPALSPHVCHSIGIRVDTHCSTQRLAPAAPRRSRPQPVAS